MLEATNTNFFDAASKKRELEYRHFEAVLAVHGAAIHVFELLPTLPESDRIVAAGIWTKRGISAGQYSGPYLQGPTFRERRTLSRSWRTKKGVAFRSFVALR